MSLDEQDVKQIEGMLNRAVAVITEDAQHKFEILAEGHKMLAGKMDRIDSKFDRIELILDRIDTRFDKMDVKVDQVKL